MNNRASPFSDYSKHDCSPQPSPVKCLGWAVELLLDVLLCAAVAPSPVECLGWAVKMLLDVLLCGAVAPSPEGSDE